MTQQKSRAGHGGPQLFEAKDGSRYEVETQDGWWGIRFERLHLDRYIDLLAFLRSDKVFLSVRIDGVQQCTSLIKLSGVSVSFEDAGAEHRFGGYIYVTRNKEIDRDQIVRFSEEGRVELSMVLGFELPSNTR